MTTRLFVFAPFLLPLVVGCSGPPQAAPADAGPADAHTGDAATGQDSGFITADGGLAAQCQAKALHFQSLCAGDDIRPCLWGAYAQLCVIGQTQLLIDAMNCLDSTVCRTFSDPNEGEACLQQVHGNQDSATAKSFIQTLCSGSCSSMCPAMRGDMEVYPYLSDSDLTALSSCSSNDVCSALQTTDAGRNACITQNQGLSLFLTCLK